MSERILRALMQLFALVAKGQSSSGREVVRTFLSQQLGSSLVEKYLEVFDEYFKEYHGEEEEQVDKKRKRISKSSVKILRICTAINGELVQKQKVIVLMRLLQFINTEGEIGGQELDFVSTVADTFNIDEQEFLRCLHFVKAKKDDIQDSENILVVNSSDGKYLERAHHIRSEGIHGEIRVLSVHSVSLYVLRYFGAETLFMNGQPLQPDRVHILGQGASIRSTGMLPIHYSDIVGKFLRSSVTKDVTFEVKDVEFFFPNGNRGLHKTLLRERSGQMLGIMGVSGAGKSTFLNILNGTQRPSSGTVSINGISIYDEPHRVEGLIGYISQDDLLMEDLTVFENLYYNARLCFDGYSRFRLTKMVLAMLKSLGLYEIRDLKVGSPLNKKISGGQRKRLNIALELIREPSILFVDEPTSGLSSRDSENIMDLIKELALKGNLVFVVIHQPSSDIYKMFDKLMILDTGGYPVYYGNPIEAISYFKSQINDVTSEDVECHNCGNVSSEQVFNIIESRVLDEYGQLTQNRKVLPKEWNEKFIASKRMKAELAPDNGSGRPLPKGSSTPSWFEQFKVFITRDVRSKMADMQYVLINFLETPVLAIILASLVRYYANDDVGYLFRENDNIPAYMFMCVVVALFFGLTVSAEEIIKDRKILKREAFLNLSRSGYLTSKVMVMFFISAVQTLSFVLIGNTILEIQGMNMAYFLVLFSTSCFSNMLGLNISASFRNAVTIYILVPFLIIPQLLLSGVIVKFDKLNPGFSSDEFVPVTGDVMASKWAYEALAVYQFKNNAYQKPFFEYDKSISEATFRKDYWAPEVRKRVIVLEELLLADSATHEKAVRLSDLVEGELRREMLRNPEVQFERPERLAQRPMEVGTLEDVKKFLDRASRHYVKVRNRLDAEKDKAISAYLTTPEERERFNALRDECYNESLSDMLLNNKDFYRIIERDGKLMQRFNPVYQDPSSRILRSHFFASRKQFFGFYVDTYWANIMVIWLMTLMLGITLHFDVLRRVLGWLSEFTNRPPTRFGQ